jgi:dolichyl-phosphate-mannose-protein mannosyltransferase
MSDGAREAVSVSTSRRPIFPLTWWMLPAVIAPAYLLRLFQVGRVVNFLDDRYVNAPGALNFVRWGMPGPDNWFTQPAKHLWMFLSIVLFGNDPFGWSMRQVLFGTGVVLLTFLLARRIFRVPFPALFATVLVALDPTWVVFSRAGSEDPPAVFFILAALILWTRAIQDDSDWDLLGAGVLVGLATATRWYAGLIAVVLLAVTLVVRRRKGAEALASACSALVAAPIAAYLLPFLPWMARGNSLADLWQLNTRPSIPRLRR